MTTSHSDGLFRVLAGDLQGWATAIFGDRFSALSTLASVPSARRHLWLMVFAQLTHRSERAENACDLELWHERLIKSSRRDIARAAGFGDCVGLARCLSRLDWPAFRNSESYITLLDVLSTPENRRKVLLHRPQIDEHTVRMVGAFDDSIQQPALMEAFLGDRRYSLISVRQFCWRLRRIRALNPELADRIAGAVAGGADPAPDDLWYGAGFPGPPWPGTTRLAPLTSPEQLSQAGRDFRNCLAHQSGSVRDGHSYFYRFADIAVLELVEAKGIGWEISQVLGPKNRKLEASELAALTTELRDAPDYICNLIPEYARA